MVTETPEQHKKECAEDVQEMWDEIEKREEKVDEESESSKSEEE